MTAKLISTIIKVALGILFVFLGVKVALFFHNYDRIPFHDFFMIIGAVFIIAGAMLLRRAVNPKPRTPEQLLSDEQSDLTRRGEKVTIDLETCRIEPVGDEADNKYILACAALVNGTPHEYKSAVISLEKIAISFKMTNQRTTTLYVDPKDPTHYYFDIRFLSQWVYH
jgi:hypothetical protein